LDARLLVPPRRIFSAGSALDTRGLAVEPFLFGFDACNAARDADFFPEDAPAPRDPVATAFFPARRLLPPFRWAFLTTTTLPAQ